MATNGSVWIHEDGKLKIAIVTYADGHDEEEVARLLQESGPLPVEDIARLAGGHDMTPGPVILIVSRDFAEGIHGNIYGARPEVHWDTTLPEPEYVERLAGRDEL